MREREQGNAFFELARLAFFSCALDTPASFPKARRHKARCKPMPDRCIDTNEAASRNRRGQRRRLVGPQTPRLPTFIFWLVQHACLLRVPDTRQRTTGHD